MADNVLEMEVRLKDFISKNLNTIEKNLKDVDKVAKTSFKSASGSANSFMNTLKGFISAQAIIAGVTKAWNLLKNVMKESVELYKIQVNAEAGLAAALEYNTQGLINYAAALQKKTTYGDEAIIEAETLIAAFIKEEKQIKKLIPAIMDLAAAKRMNLRNAADLVTKSVASSTNAMARYGIEIEGAAGSVERIDSAVSVLTEKFGGMAEALAQTDVGKLTQVENRLGDISEVIGKELIPLQTEWMELMEKLASGGLTKMLTNLIKNQRILWTSYTYEQAILESYAQRIQKIENINTLNEINLQKTKIMASMEHELFKLSEKEGQKSRSNMMEEVKLKQKILKLQQQITIIEKHTDSMSDQTKKTSDDDDKSKGLTDEEKALLAKKQKELWDWYDKRKVDEIKKESDIQKSLLNIKIQGMEAQLETMKIVDDVNLERQIVLIEANKTGQEKELALLDLHYANLLTKYSEYSEEYNVLTQLQEAQKSEIVNRYGQERVQQQLLDQETIKVCTIDSAQTINDALLSLARTATSNSKAEAKKRKNLLYGMAIVDAGAAAVKGVYDVWSGDGNWKQKLAYSAAVVASIVASTATQISNIKNAKMHTGGIHDGMNRPNGSGELDTTVLPGEMTLTRGQQANLYRMAQTGGESKTTNNNNTNSESSTYNINWYGSGGEEDIDRLHENLKELVRENRLSPKILFTY